jgi:hypothetical protein
VRRHRRATALSWGSPVLRGLVCDRVASFWTSDASPATSCSREPIPLIAVPRVESNRVHSALDRTPFRVPHHLPAVRPVGRTDSPEVSAPCDDSTRTSPCWREDVHPRTGSARRFSQPPGGFTAGPGLRPCFVPLPPVGYLSLQSLPSQGSLHPSRGRLLPCGHPRAPACAARGLVTAGFADARVIADALAGLPPRLWAPFRPTTHGWEASWSPWTARGGLTPGRTVHPLRSLDPLAKSAPLDPTSFLVGAAVLSWVSSPPEPSPPAPRTL